jgi:hypothetical protein
MTTYDHLNFPSTSVANIGGNTGIAPGKRSLTQSLPPVQRSLRDEQRAVVSLDEGAGAGADFYDERATVDAEPTRELLTDQQIRKARRRNPHWINKLRLSAQIFSTAEVGSAAFALVVADKQAAHGALVVDGIAGPKTAAVVAGQVAEARSAADEGRFAGDDPFGMHLIADGEG